jgi:hypothetical protein
MREYKELSAGSYSSLISSIKSYTEKLPKGETVEAFSMLYDIDSNSSNKHKALIIVRSDNHG